MKIAYLWAKIIVSPILTIYLMKVNAYFDNIQSEIILALQGAKSSIKVAMYYFTNDAILNTLTALAKKGVKIELILFDENNDFQLNKYIKLIELDSKIYLYLTEGSDRIKMHHKFCIIDDHTVITGSYNWTINAKTNRENVVIIGDCNDCASKFVKEFDSIKLSSKLFSSDTSDDAKTILNFHSIPSCYFGLDRIIHGFEKGTVTLVGGASSMGKTAFLLNISYNVSRSTEKVAFFTLSETKVKLTEKLLSIESGINNDAIRYHLTQKTEEIAIALNRFSHLPIYIADILDTQISSIIENIKAAKLQYGVNVFFIDYLELIVGDAYTEKSYDFHSNIIRRLKLIARQLNIVIIIASCLKRKKNERQSPSLFDLAYNIENYADVILFLYRPEYYGICEWEDGSSTLRMLRVIVAKNRNGYSGEIALTFAAQSGIISDIESNFTEINSMDTPYVSSRMNGIDSDFDFSPSSLDFKIGLDPNARPDDGFSPF